MNVIEWVCALICVAVFVTTLGLYVKRRYLFISIGFVDNNECPQHHILVRPWHFGVISYIFLAFYLLIIFLS